MLIQKSTGTMEAAGVLHSLFYSAGAPGAAAAPSPGLAGAALTSYPGQLPFSNPAAGNTHLMRLAAGSTITGRLYLCDRLWHNSGFTVTTTTAQTVNSAAWPARCPDIANGDAPNSDGFQAVVGIEVSAATTNAGAITNMTLQYTDQSGNAGATGTIPSFPATAAAGTFVPFNLAAGDTGVRSVQSLTLGTSLATGTVHLVAYRVLAEVAAGPGVDGAIDMLTSGFPRFYDNSVPFLLWLPSATTAANINGSLVYTQG